MGGALTPAQKAAIDHVRGRGRAGAADAAKRISALTGTPAEDLIAGVRRRAVVTLNFHPDRIAADGRTVVEAMLADGVYRNQFETRISAGGLTAFPGGDRDRWEERLFGGAYHQRGVTEAERPKYGGLNLMAHPDGACPRFGSCHLRLGGHVVERATFCFGDSHVGPRDVGTIDAFEPVLAALLEDAAATGHALGRDRMDVGQVVGLLTTTDALGATGNGRALDEYIEAQVHGDVALPSDADAIVADPSFRGTTAGDQLEAVADRYDLALGWHAGFALAASDVPDDFRGPAIPPLAARVVREFGAPHEPVTAELIGRAAASVVREPERWADRGPVADTLQHLKQLWHVLVRFGHPIAHDRERDVRPSKRKPIN